MFINRRKPFSNELFSPRGLNVIQTVEVLFYYVVSLVVLLSDSEVERVKMSIVQGNSSVNTALLC